MRYLLATAMALLAMATSAYAQSSPMSSAASIGQHAAQAKAHTGENDQKQVKANDKAYNAALRNMPDKQYDPWRGVR